MRDQIFEAMIILVVIVMLAGPLLVYLSGNMFGQRCKAMGYEGIEYEMCISALSEGKKPWEVINND